MDEKYSYSVSLQGDRFGGALDAAAKQFSDAYESKLIPMEFVNQMRKEGKLIMGIGHRVKSVSRTVAVKYRKISQILLLLIYYMCKNEKIKRNKDGLWLPWLLRVVKMGTEHRNT